MYTTKQNLSKAPVAVVKLGIDWTQFLDTNETVETSEWSCESTDIVFSRQQLTTNVASCRIGGGVMGKVYKIFNTVTTTGGDIDRRYIVVKIEDIQLAVG